MNVEIMKRVMCEKKTALPSLSIKTGKPPRQTLKK